MYKQDLYSVQTSHLQQKYVKKLNKSKSFKYGFNIDLDCVIISKDGTLGDIYVIQGLRVGLPATPKKVQSNSNKPEEQVYTRTQKPETLDKIKTLNDFKK